MSSFGTGTTTTGGSSIVLTAFTGTNGAQAGTDGLVPGPSVNQAGYVLGAGGDWTLSILGGIALNESSDRIATTEFVQDVVGNAVLGGNAQLSQLTDVTIAGLADNQFLQYNAGAGKWENATLTLSLISDVNLAGLVDGNALVYDANAGQWVPGQGGGGGAANLNDLGDVSVANLALGQFLVFNGNDFVNQTLDVVLTSAGATFGAFAYDFTLSTVSVKAPTLDTHASTKKYVDDEVATKQPLEATLTGLANIAPVDNDLIIATGNDTFGVVNISADLETFLGTDAELGNLSNVTIGGVGLANSQVLKYSNGAWINGALDFSEISGTGNVALLNANQTFTGTVLADTQAVNDNSTKLSTTAFVQNEIAALNLGTASQNDTGDFLASNASIADLSDVSSIANIQDGNVLAWVAVNNRFEFTAPAQTYTDEDARDASGTALQGGAHTGISFSNNDNADTIDATVSLGGFSVGALSDVSLVGVGNGKILKYNNGSFEVADETDTNTQLSDEQVQDIVGPMFIANNAGNTGITFSYDDTEGVNDGTVTATVSLSSTELGDGANVSRLDADQTLSGDKTFTGALDLTGATATVANPTQNAHPTTKSYVDTQVDTKQASSANLTSISGLNIVDGSMMIGNGANSFEILTIQLGVENFLKSTGRVAALSDVTVNNDALNNANHILVSTGSGGFESQTISTANLSNSGDIVLENAGATFGDNTYDFTGATAITVPAPQNASDATTKTYVDTQVATKQPLEATLTGLASIAPVDNDLIIATGNDTFGVINTTAGVQTFLSSDGSLDGLDNVTIAGNLGNALADGQTLRYDGANQLWKNSKLAFVDLDSNAASTQNVALLNGNQTFTGANVFTDDITATTAGKYISANTPTQDSHVATKKYVDDEMGAAGNISSLTTLTDVTIGADNGNGVAEAVGQVLKIASIANGDATYRNAQLAYTDLSGTPVIGVDIQAYDASLSSIADTGTGADKYIYTTGVDTWAEGTITSIGRQILDDADAGAVRTTLGLGTSSVKDEDFFLASTSDLNALSDVTIGADNGNGVAEAVGQVLKIASIANGVATYRNESLDVSDVSGISDFAETILDDADAGAVRTTLGLGTSSVKDEDFFLASTSGLDALSDVIVAGVSDAQILVYDGDQIGDDNNQFKNVSVSGVIALSNAGVASFATDAINENNIATAIKDGVITNTYLASSFVNLTAGGNTNKLNLGETITFSGTANEVEVSTTADANGDVAGATITIGLPQNVTIGNNLTVDGNLIVSGTTTTVDTTNVEIKDRVISLNKGVAGDNNKDIGLYFDRGGLDPALFIWDESENVFKLGTEVGATDSQAGDYDITLSKMEVGNPDANSNTTEVATTSWVRTHTSGLASSLNDLTDATIANVSNAQFLVYDGNNGNVFKNVSLSGDVSVTEAGAVSISEGVIVNADINAGAAIAVSKLASSNVTVGTTSITLGSSSTTLSGMTGIDFANQDASFGASLGNKTLTVGGVLSTIDIVGTLTVNDPTADAHASTKSYVDTQVATKQASDATLTALAGLTTGVKKLIYSTANDTLEMTSLSDNAKTFLASDAGLNDLDGVTIANSANKHFLVSDANGDFSNRAVSSSDLSDEGNIALIDADQTFTGTVSVSTQVEGNNTTRVASTAFVQQEITALDLANSYQAKDATLTALAGVNTASNKLIYATDADTFTTTDLSVFGRSLIDDADASTARSTLGVEVGSNVQAYNVALDSLASMGTGANKLIYSTDVDTFAESDLTAFARSILDDADAGAVRATLGLGDSSTLDTTTTGGNADAGMIVKTDGDGKLGAIDGANLTALGSIALHTDVDLTDFENDQGLVYSNGTFVAGNIAQNISDMGDVVSDNPQNGQVLQFTTTGDNANKYVNTTLDVPTHSDHYLSNQNETKDLVVDGRFIESIDYGSVTTTFDANSHYAIDFGTITDSVEYCREDYGVLVC